MPKAGPYFLYMCDFKKQQERALGRSLSMSEVSQMASDSWNSMSEDDKAYYKEKSKGGDVKVSRRPTANTGQLTTQGLPVALYEREEREKKHEEERMRRRVGSMVQRIPLLTDFLSHPIYLMYGNYFYKNSDGTYFPAELAMCKFTFRDGVIKKLHTFISQDGVELGFAYTAKAHSQSTHRLPTPPNSYGEKNFGRILYEIQKFMKDDNETFDGGNQMVFTYGDPYASEENQIDVLKSFMGQFAGGKEVKFDLYPLTRLFYALQKEFAARGRCDDIPNENFSNVFLSRDPYEVIGGISCQYHEEIDATRHCALSRVRRWTFLLADHFCERLGVQLIPGTHLPKNADLPKSLSSLDSLSVSGSDSESVTSEGKDGFEGDVKTLRERFSRSGLTSDVKSEDEKSQKSSRDRDTRSSASTLNYDIQSIRTSSTATNGSGRGKIRPSRASILAGSLPPQVNSSTFYNP